MGSLPPTILKRAATAILLSTAFVCGAHNSHRSTTIRHFDKIEPSANISWTPCFDGLSCSRLEVPLDYNNKSLGETAIAFIKLAGKNATDKSPSIVVIPGGPGGSGVDLLISTASLAQMAFGDQYNLVSFDPRGVNNSGPSLDCFGGNKKARAAFQRLHNIGITNLSTTSVEEQYYSSSIYGEWCNDAVENESSHGYYVTTSAVACDLLTFIEAEARATDRKPSDAKLLSYGISYGTVISATFASMFPDRVGRMVLDGVVDAELYYKNDYTANVDQSDEAVHEFANLCHSAGLTNCSFWGPSPANITKRLDNIIHQIQDHPIPISNTDSQGLPGMATYADLKALILNAIYRPIAEFPGMAEVLHLLEQGNASALVGAFAKSIIPSDGNHVIQCSDADGRNSITTLEDFRSYVEYTVSKSTYIGDIYPIYVDSILCRAIRPNLPGSMMVHDRFFGKQKKTAHPIMFTSNTVDPITPLRSARKMSSLFPDSVVLQQEGVGHTVINQGASECYFGHIQAYFAGILPPSNTTCAQQFTPFVDSPF